MGENCFRDAKQRLNRDLKPSDFKTFFAYVVGLWSTMPIKVDKVGEYSFDRNQFNLPSQIKDVSRKVEEQHYSSSKMKVKNSRKKKLKDKMKRDPISIISLMLLTSKSSTSHRSRSNFMNTIVKL